MAIRSSRIGLGDQVWGTPALLHLFWQQLSLRINMKPIEILSITISITLALHKLLHLFWQLIAFWPQHDANANNVNCNLNLWWCTAFRRQKLLSTRCVEDCYCTSSLQSVPRKRFIYIAGEFMSAAAGKQLLTAGCS